MMEGSFEGAEEDSKPFLKLLAKHVIQERKRLGGNMVVAQAIFARNHRKFLREIIGPDLVFMVLNIEKDHQVRRMKKRGENENIPEKFLKMQIKYAEICEPASEDEKNAFNIDITEEMTKEDVVKKILHNLA